LQFALSGPEWYVFLFVCACFYCHFISIFVTNEVAAI